MNLLGVKCDCGHRDEVRVLKGVVYEFQGQNVKKSEIWGEKTKRQEIQCVKWGKSKV